MNLILKQNRLSAALLLFLLLVSDIHSGSGRVEDQTRSASDTDVLTLMIQPGNTLPVSNTVYSKSLISFRHDSEAIRGTDAIAVTADHQMLELHIIAIYSDALKNRRIYSRGTYS